MLHSWQDLTRAELARLGAEGALVVVPTGATEQHGDHLPVDTDTRLAAAIARRAAERAAGAVVVAPPVAAGFSPHHAAWAGTLSLRLETYLALLGDLARSVLGAGFRRMLFVNGHGGNTAPLRSLVGQMVTDGHAVGMIDYFAPSEADWVPLLRGALPRVGHACEMETSLSMALATPDKAAAIARAIRDLPSRCTQPWMAEAGDADPITAAGAGWPPIFQPGDCGYYGDPATATAETGDAILAVVTEGLAGFFDAFANANLRVGTRGGLAPQAAGSSADRH
ncbi:creatininase family protein [Salipiger mucosus]|uniref:Creatinine amidohydrolase family protein n=1 Tax=Salipiger mucosus DSM 16094 TaxID=1123237 RepID=S9RUZ0_9RHOB|nr:creatininase family protein [Salipiger mucosus]EPX81865.1 creatinine amidohydrolase family protein [Salipiger mucosus DSM 16094]